MASSVGADFANHEGRESNTRKNWMFYAPDLAANAFGGSEADGFDVSAGLI
jgi:hypothetical protein